MCSSRTTTTGAITRASIISPRPTSTSGEAKPSCGKEKGSNAKPSKTVACFTTNKPHNINQDAPDPLLDQAASCLKISDDGHPKEVAQIGAAIGREFTHALLAAVVRKPEQELRPALDRIVWAGLLLRQGGAPH